MQKNKNHLKDIYLKNCFVIAKLATVVNYQTLNISVLKNAPKALDMVFAVVLKPMELANYPI
jgi:hypothetical protein